MSRLAAACLVVACFVPALAGSGASAQSVPSASHRPPPIPGTLDPATGKFTPDAAGSVSGSSVYVERGTLNLVFDLDAVHAVTISVVCSIDVGYFIGDEFVRAGGESTREFLKFNDRRNHFEKDLEFPYTIAADPDAELSAEISVECSYTFDPKTVIFSTFITGPLSEFSEPQEADIVGEMNGRHLN